MSTAFNIGGSNNTVQAGPGPFAIAGLINQANAGITQSGPGIHINSIVVGGASAVSGKKSKSTDQKTTKSSASAKATGGSARR